MEKESGARFLAFSIYVAMCMCVSCLRRERGVFLLSITVILCCVCLCFVLFGGFSTGIGCVISLWYSLVLPFKPFVL